MVKFRKKKLKLPELPELSKPQKEAVKKHFHKIRHPVKHIKQKRAGGSEANVTSTAVVPYITNETVAEHREEVLKGARKYIYPLQHSKHKIVVISSALFITTVMAILVYGGLALYKFQSTSTFVYRIAQVIPLPIARVDGHFVSYESYLFELRHYIHYYQTQQKLDFSTKEGQQQLDNYKQRALQDVIDQAYVKKLAKQNGVSVSSQEIDTTIALVRDQNRLGASDRVFEDVLRDFWGWSLNDFKRSLRDQLLTRKVVSKLDVDAHTKAEAALSAIKAGTPFADIAKRYSDDADTKDNGGEYSGTVDKSNRDIDARVTAAMFALQPGQVSDVIDTGYTLEIVQLNSFENGKAHASHIQINLKDISVFLDPLKAKEKSHRYIKV